MRPDFTDAHIKLCRARHHIAEIKSQIATFLVTDFYRLRFETNHRKGRVEVIFDSLHQPDKSVNALIGDAVGNLRSTLDYIAVALAYPVTGKTDKTGFPFADDANGFAGEVRSQRTLGPCDLGIQNFFTQEVQAYQGGKGETFWTLNKLRNIDKHRLLVATAQLASVTASWRDRNGGTFSGVTMSISAGQSGTFIDAPIEHIEFTNEPKGSFAILLKEPPFIDGVPVEAFLDRAASATEALLNSF